MRECRLGRFKGQRGATAIDYFVAQALIITIIILILFTLAPKPPADTPPPSNPPSDPYAGAGAQTEWTMAVGEMEAIMAAQDMYMDTHGGTPANSVDELEDAGLMNEMRGANDSTDYNYTTGASDGGFFVAAEPNPAGDPTGPNPEQPFFSFQSGDTLRMEMGEMPTIDSMPMDTFLETCFPAGAGTTPPTESCPDTSGGRMEQSIRAIGHLVTHMDEIVPPEMIADPYAGLPVTDRDEFLEPIVTMVMKAMDRMDGQVDGIIDTGPAMQNLTMDKIEDLTEKIMEKMDLEPTAPDESKKEILLTELTNFKKRMKKDVKKRPKLELPASKKKKNKLRSALKNMIPGW